LSVVLGIDTGGTFTDFVLVDHEGGSIATAKVPSTPSDPAKALAAGLAKLGGVQRADRVVIGTTVATNAVIERRGPRVLFITNRGFEDVPFIGRMDKERIYDLNWRKPKPLMNRRDSIGIGGRLDRHGAEIAVLDEQDLADLRDRLSPYADEEVAVAICCLFAFLDGTHERRAGNVVKAVLPRAEMSMSHEVSPLWREYERASTTIADAFVKPVVSRYVDRVGGVLRASSSAERWNFLASNGGYLSAEQALRRPAQLLISGLAGGVIGGRYFAERARHDAAFILDMGGTSSDIGLVRAGTQQYASEFKIDFGIPVTIPCVAVQTIGAGGGSIGWVDKGGFLRVGPRSAGAEPGPASYGRGGTDPTVTDANLVLGRLDPEYFLDGAMPLNLGAARAALGRLGEAVSLSAEKAALAMIRIVDENMANAIRLIAVERGLDVRDFALIAFGGAGPLHSASVARSLGMRTVIVPPHPGLCSAFGAAIADARVDRMQTFLMRSEDVDFGALASALRRLQEATAAELRVSVPGAEPMLHTSADMRYAGQNYEIEVALPSGDMNRDRWNETLRSFAEAHQQLYGFALAGEPVELINLRATAVSPEPPRRYQVKPPDRRLDSSSRSIWFQSDVPLPCPVMSRTDVASNGPVVGPAVIEEADSTTLVFPGECACVDESGIMILTIGDHA
jgi:N-methylhydantoinase A